MDNTTAQVFDLLYRLGVTANYTGFFHTAEAVAMCVERPDRLLMVTKCLYPDVAKRYETNWKAVERNIRCCWNSWPADRWMKSLKQRNFSPSSPPVSCGTEWPRGDPHGDFFPLTKRS